MVLAGYVDDAAAAPADAARSATARTEEDFFRAALLLGQPPLPPAPLCGSARR